MPREITVRLLILDDETVWCRQGGTMRQVPNLTYEDLEDVGEQPAKVKRKYTRRQSGGKSTPRKQPAKSQQARKSKQEKSGGGGDRVTRRATPRPGGSDVDRDAVRQRALAGEPLTPLSRETGIPYATLYGWKRARSGSAGPARTGRKRLEVTSTAEPARRKSRGIPDADHPVTNGRRYCTHCGQTSPEEHQKCLHCFEKFAA